LSRSAANDASKSAPATPKDRFVEEARWSRRKPEEAKPPVVPRPAPGFPSFPSMIPAMIPEPWGGLWKSALDFQMGLFRNLARFSPVGMALDIRLWTGALDGMIRDMAPDDPVREARVVRETADYDIQLAAIMDVLDALIDRLDPGNAEDAEALRRAVARFRELKGRIADKQLVDVFITVIGHEQHMHVLKLLLGVIPFQLRVSRPGKNEAVQDHGWIIQAFLYVLDPLM
jgi:hypothetical protein